MAHTLTLTVESQTIAQELHALIKQLEAANWREELATIQTRLSNLSARIRELLGSTEASEDDAVLLSLREKLQNLGRFVDEQMPKIDQTKEQFKQEWQAYKQKLILSYEALAANLKLRDIHVPSLRPTNYTRNVFHAGMGLGVFSLIVFFPWSSLKWVALGFFVWAWSMELGRRHSKTLNGLLMKALGPVAHPHEHYRVNSATWYVTALMLMSVTVSGLVASVAVAILALADPAAAIIGRRWGKTQLYSGRTLEGTLTFVLVGTLAATCVLWFFNTGQLAFFTVLLLALGGAIPAAIAELYSKRVDDNLTIPLSASLGITLVALAFGLSL